MDVSIPAGEVAVKPSDRDYWPAVGAAMVDAAMRNWAQPRSPEEPSEPPHTAFTREHVSLLRSVGCTRAQVLAYAGQFLNPSLVAKLAGDLDSYGAWR